MNILKQSTAATIKLGPFVDDTDGKTAETALTIGQADIRLSKNGGDIAQTNNATGATHDELGYYDIPLDTTDTGTLGRLRVLISKAGALPVWQDFLIVTANVFDTFCSTGSLNVNAASLSTDAITAASVKAEAVTKIQNGLATSAALDTVDANVDSILADTGTDGVKIADTQGAITWGQQKIIADAEDEGALHIVNTNENGVGQANIGGLAGLVNDGDTAVGNFGETYGMYSSGNTAGMYNSGKTAGMHNYSAKMGGAGMKNEAQGTSSSGMSNEAWGSSSIGIRNIGTTRNVAGYDPDQATEATLTAMKGAGWTNETLVKIVTDIAAISAGSGATAQEVWEYATRVLTAGTNIDLSALATATDLATVDTVVDAIKAKTDNLPANTATALAAIQSDLDNPAQYKADVSGLATTAHVQEVENKIDAIDVTVNTIPTNPLLDTAYTAPDNAGIAAIKAKTNLIPANPAVADEYDAALAAIQADLDNPDQYKADVSGLATSAEVGAITMLDEVVVGSYTMQDILKILAAKMVGKATGGSTATITYRGVDDTSDVIIETVDSNGNRSAVTLTV